MENKSKLTMAGIVAGVVLPVFSLIYGIRSYNHYVDNLVSRSVKEMFPAGNVLEMSAEEYCKMKGKSKSDYFYSEIHGSLNPFRKNDGSFRIIPNKKDGFESLIITDTEVVVGFHRGDFKGKYRYPNGECAHGIVLMPLPSDEEMDRIKSDPLIAEIYKDLEKYKKPKEK